MQEKEKKRNNYYKIICLPSCNPIYAFGSNCHSLYVTVIFRTFLSPPACSKLLLPLTVIVIFFTLLSQPVYQFLPPYAYYAKSCITPSSSSVRLCHSLDAFIFWCMLFLPVFVLFILCTLVQIIPCTTCYYCWLRTEVRLQFSIIFQL